MPMMAKMPRTVKNTDDRFATKKYRIFIGFMIFLQKSCKGQSSPNYNISIVFCQSRIKKVRICFSCEAGKVFATKMYEQYIAGEKTFYNEADEVNYDFLFIFLNYRAALVEFLSVWFYQIFRLKHSKFLLIYF